MANASGNPWCTANFRPSRSFFHPADKPETSLSGMIRRLRPLAYRGAPEWFVQGGLKFVPYPGSGLGFHRVQALRGARVRGKKCTTIGYIVPIGGRGRHRARLPLKGCRLHALREPLFNRRALAWALFWGTEEKYRRQATSHAGAERIGGWPLWQRWPFGTVLQVKCAFATNVCASQSSRGDQFSKAKQRRPRWQRIPRIRSPARSPKNSPDGRGIVAHGRQRLLHFQNIPVRRNEVFQKFHAGMMILLDGAAQTQGATLLTDWVFRRKASITSQILIKFLSF